MGTGTDLLIKTEWEDRLDLIRRKFAYGLDEAEFELFLYQAKRLDLNPLLREIWAVKYGTDPAQIFVGRDGHLTIAHKSGQFDGMRTEITEVQRPFEARYYDKKEHSWKSIKFDSQFMSKTTVWRKDMTHPVEHTVFEEEYSSGRNLWTTKRRTMIQKVSEAQALRRAFNINGVYSPEEFDKSWQEYDVTEVVQKTVEETPELPDAIEPDAIDEGATEFPVEKVATEKQLKAIWAGLGKLSKKLEKEKDELEDTLKRFYKVEHLQELTPEQASKAIENINKQLNKS